MFRSFTKIYMKDNCVNSLGRIAFRLQCPGTAGVSPRSPTEGVLLITNGVGYQTRVSNHSKHHTYLWFPYLPLYGFFLLGVSKFGGLLLLHREGPFTLRPEFELFT